MGNACVAEKRARPFDIAQELVEAGDHAKLRELLQTNASLILPNKHGNLLALVASKGDTDLSELVLSAARHVLADTAQETGVKLLRLKLLMRFGLDVSVDSIGGKLLNMTETPTRGPLYVAKIPLSALLTAAKCGHWPMIKWMMQQGCNLIQAQPVTGYTVLHVAAQHGQAGVVQELLQCTHIVEGVSGPVPVCSGTFKPSVSLPECTWPNMFSLARVTPLMVASYYGQEECVRLLLSYGALVHLRTAGTGALMMPSRSTALHCGSRTGHTNVCKLLLQAQVMYMGTAGNRQRTRWEGNSRLDIRIMRNAVNAIPYSYARHLFQDEILSNLLDPSIPLSVVLDNVDYEDCMSVGVPTLYFLASRALRQHLMTRLGDLEAILSRACEKANDLGQAHDGGKPGIPSAIQQAAHTDSTESTSKAAAEEPRNSTEPLVAGTQQSLQGEGESRETTTEAPRDRGPWDASSATGRGEVTGTSLDLQNLHAFEFHLPHAVDASVPPRPLTAPVDGLYHTGDAARSSFDLIVTASTPANARGQQPSGPVPCPAALSAVPPSIRAFLATDPAASDNRARLTPLPAAAGAMRRSDSSSAAQLGTATAPLPQPEAGYSTGPSTECRTSPFDTPPRRSREFNFMRPRISHGPFSASLVPLGSPHAAPYSVSQPFVRDAQRAMSASSSLHGGSEMLRNGSGRLRPRRVHSISGNTALPLAAEDGSQATRAAVAWVPPPLRQMTSMPGNLAEARVGMSSGRPHSAMPYRSDSTANRRLTPNELLDLKKTIAMVDLDADSTTEGSKLAVEGVETRFRASSARRLFRQSMPGHQELTWETASIVGAKSPSGTAALDDSACVKGDDAHSQACSLDYCCGICLDAQVQIAAQSCGHSLCLTCARELCSYTTSPAMCPFCRTLIRDFTNLEDDQALGDTAHK